MEKQNPTISSKIATFTFYGPKQPSFASDLNGWRNEGFLPFNKVVDGEWKIEIELDMDAYLEYCFYIGKKRILDPLNTSITPNGMGKFNNFLYMPEGKSGIIHQDSINTKNPGSLSKLQMKTFGLIPGNHRNVSIYKPEKFSVDLPLLVVLDGQDYLERIHINRLIDYLIENNQIPPLAMILIDSKPSSRTVEYACSESNLIFITEIVIPQVERELRLKQIQERPGAYGILGASLGGLFAMFAGLRKPEIFGKVISQSGAFTINHHPFVVWDLLKTKENINFDVFMDVGKYEWLLESNKAFYNEIKKKSNRNSGFHVYNAGHNYPAWYKDLPNCLSSVFK